MTARGFLVLRAHAPRLVPELPRTQRPDDDRGQDHAVDGVHRERVLVRARPPHGGIRDALIDQRQQRCAEQAAQAAKTGCPVSKALTGTTITLDAALD